ncbi:MAG: DUF4278 domain-containing protein [Leptolyngbya sp. SIOISBB]|nr:DUF4278 domain-containing protein [Leptolyngbya sp. SIOISBB]
MKMIYRGIAFKTLVAGTPAVATEQTGTFLGQPYAMKEPRQHFRQPSETLTYRGVEYTR